MVGGSRFGYDSSEAITSASLPRVFSDRIQCRYKRFWKTRRFGFHGKGRCLLTYLSRTDPIEKWHCCDLWQRKLSNKWNSREFALMHGFRVPDLYWSGSDPGRIPFDSLPEHYVVRPVVGHSRRGVYVMANGVNLLDGQTYTPDQLSVAIRRGLRPLTRRRVLVEEFIRSESGDYSLPDEYKFYAFRSQLAGVLYIRRAEPARSLYFTENWERLPALHPAYPWPETEPLPEPPRCFEELRSCAAALGRAYETFVRVDLYASDRGCIFGEFTATPAKGLGFTDFCNERFERYWLEMSSDGPGRT
jgi:hypothetical protein